MNERSRGSLKRSESQKSSQFDRMVNLKQFLAKVEKSTLLGARLIQTRNPLETCFFLIQQFREVCPQAKKVAIVVANTHL